MYKLIFAFLLMNFSVQAQMVDVRHLSTQRAKENPYGVAVDRTPKYQRKEAIKKQFIAEQKDLTEEEQIAENAQKVEQDKNAFNLDTPNLNKPIRQTGVNIIQPKDTRKIFDSSISTTEYDSLKTHKKQDVQERIFIDD